jgi:cytosine/creatinine deaminase
MTAEPAGGLVLTNAAGVPGSVRILGDQVAAVGHDVRPAPGDSVADLAGYVLLPGLAEPHVHLDKVFTASRAEPATPDLAGAIAAWYDLRGELTEADFTARARRAAAGYLASGTTVIRAHIDVSPVLGTIPVAAVRTVGAELAGMIDIEIVAGAGLPVTGAGGRENVAALRDAIDAGAGVVGGAPWLDPDPGAACHLLFGIAAAAGLPVDLHVDETTAQAADTLSMIIDLVWQGFGQRVTASHAVSLASRRPETRQRIAEALAEAGIGVVTLPQTNLWLQGRGAGPAPARGLTAVRALREAGVPVAAGADNIRDPFNPLGRTDPLETASLLAAAAHLTPAQALAAVTADAWTVLGRPAPAIRPGAPARFVAVATDTDGGGEAAGDAVAAPPPDRIVIRGARIAARTSVNREFPQARESAGARHQPR